MPDEAALLAAKIFPRNLTARAATKVRGNPANARPESGVDNTHPGLEFDQRNLDQGFFPGLRFEFQFLTGARLVAISPDRWPELKADDVPDYGTSSPHQDPDTPHLLYLVGSFGNDPGYTAVAQMFGLDGYEALRIVRDLEPGPVIVVVGRKINAADVLASAQQSAALMAYSTQLGTLINKRTGHDFAASVLPPIRDDNGKLICAMLTADRASFLDANGVITAETAPPGVLTQSLCAPWQWDFADCGCHYWAANKPDIVIGPDGTEQVLNFQRDRSKAPPARPDASYKGWNAGIMSQPDMIAGWESLPFVIAERETSRAPRPASLPSPDPWTKARVIAELRYLATIEHALAIEYLYAYYSLDAPRQPPEPHTDPMKLNIFTAAQVIRSIAVDEMRHFRWANEALQLLGADPCIDRAEKFTEGGNTIKGDFKLRPLDAETLAYFIAVEAPSKSGPEDPDSLDGLYTHLLGTLGTGVTDINPTLRQRLTEIIKMIVDEGHEHWQRFLKVQALLKDYSPDQYLRITGGPPDESAVAALDGHLRETLSLANHNYGDLLSGLLVAFAADPVDRAEHIADSRLLMYNLDDSAVELASAGVGMAFPMPPENPIEGDEREALIDTLDGTRNLLQVLANSANAGTRALIERQRGRLEQLVTRYRT